MEFMIVNGGIVKSKDANLTHLFLGDSNHFIQKIWYGFGGIPLFEENMDRLNEHLQIFNIGIPEFLLNRRELFRVSKRMLNKNKLYRSGILKFQIVEINSVLKYVITAHPSTESEFPISYKGILTDIARLEKKIQAPLCRYSFANKIYWQKEKSNLKNTSLGNAVFLNSKGMICEAIDSNIFFIKDKTLFTPSLDSGCYVDVIRDQICKASAILGFGVIETDKIQPEQLFEMNEMFLASESSGIQRVLGFKKKRYIHKLSYLIHEKLNEILKSKVD